MYPAGQDARYEEERMSKEALDKWSGTEPEDDGSERMENEGSRLTGVEEGYKGDQGPSWTVAPVNEWMKVNVSMIWVSKIVVLIFLTCIIWEWGIKSATAHSSLLGFNYRD
jgi:hypothetical protein